MGILKRSTNVPYFGKMAHDTDYRMLYNVKNDGHK